MAEVSKATEVSLLLYLLDEISREIPQTGQYGRDNAILTVQSRPGLIDNVEADSARNLVDVRMVHFVHEADGGRFEGIMLRQVDAHLPYSSFVRRWK